MQSADFVLLFSKNEGLPISLIEASMTGNPIICNDVGGNIEIAKNGRNTFVVNEWIELERCLNNLPNLKSMSYFDMGEYGRDIFI